MSEYQERWGVWCQRDDGRAWCLMPNKVTHRTYATREEAQADAVETGKRNADWTGRKWEARRYEVTTATDPRDERIKELAAEIAVYRKALAEIEVCSTRAYASYIAAQVFKEYPLPHPDTYLNNS